MVPVPGSAQKIAEAQADILHRLRITSRIERLGLPRLWRPAHTG
jgi:hypothetical protein